MNLLKRYTVPQLYGLAALAVAAVLFSLAYLGPANATGQSSDPVDRVNSLKLPVTFAQSGASDASSQAYAPGQVVVGVRRDVVGAVALTYRLQAQVIQTIDMAGLDGVDGDTGIDAYLLQTESGAEWAAIETLLADPAVAFAAPNWVVRAADVQDDEDTDEKPFRVNDPFYADEQWYLQRIHASRGWALSGSVTGQDKGPLTNDLAGTDIQVVIIDSGVEGQHPDLKDNLSLQFRNYVNPGQLPADDCGHGTHVSGLIGAGINDGRGIAGVAAGVSIVPFKALKLVQNGDGTTSCTGYVSDIAQAVRDAADLGADVVNLSLELDATWPPLEAAVNYASGKGVLLIGAAGNCVGSGCPKPVQYPAAYPAVMAVASTGYDNDRAPYSSVGSELALAAPGGETGDGILSTWSNLAVNECVSGYRIVDGWSYCEDIGTSMSAGIVSGAAALIWSAAPQRDADDVRDVLLGTLQSLPQAHDQVGGGLVDLESALRYSQRSRLKVSPRELAYVLPTATEMFETTLLLENPSLEPIRWTVTGTIGVDWLDIAEPVTGTAEYGEPVRVPVVVSPTHVISGSYRSSFVVEGVRIDGGDVVVPMSAALDVYTPTVTSELFLPVSGQSLVVKPVRPYVNYRWEMPDLSLPGTVGRVEYRLPKGGSIGITLPVTITLGGEEYTDARLYADGHMMLPASANLERASNECLQFAERSGLAIFGWWADLDPVRRNGRVSTFQSAADRFVVEYDSVQARSAPFEAYDERVSFQIVLYADGRVRLNYKETPVTSGLPPKATVGVQREDGRFYNQIGCVTSDVEVGALPSSYQSLLFRERDLY